MIATGVAGCGSPPAPGTPGAAGQHRRVGSDDSGRLITIRYGGRLDVVPDPRPGGWRITGYPRSILRLDGSPAAADNHAFTAIAVGAGQVILTAASGPEDTVTVRVQVMRDLTQHPQP